tara:strand:+ start:1203 stop:1631 length:429 start_codon:yes stop_codon:yes gene_type:complete
MAITLEEVTTFANDWFHAVASGATGDEQAKFHQHRDNRVFGGNGISFSLDEHHALHQQWKDERHVMGEFEITKINEKPERVRVDGTVYWEARNRQAADTDPLIKMVVGESWMIEKTTKGLTFILYISTTYHLLPGSAQPNFL